MNTAIIGFGSNIDPEKNIQKAKELLSKKCTLLKESPFVKTKPIGSLSQPDFMNGAVMVATSEELESLKNFLKKTEAALGREHKTDKFGPRTIDLDILVWNEKVVDQDFYTRDFVKQSVLKLLPALKY